MTRAAEFKHLAVGDALLVRWGPSDGPRSITTATVVEIDENYDVAKINVPSRLGKNKDSYFSLGNGRYLTYTPVAEGHPDYGKAPYWFTGSGPLPVSIDTLRAERRVVLVEEIADVNAYLDRLAEALLAVETWDGLGDSPIRNWEDD